MVHHSLLIYSNISNGGYLMECRETVFAQRSFTWYREILVQFDAEKLYLMLQTLLDTERLYLMQKTIFGTEELCWMQSKFIWCGSIWISGFVKPQAKKPKYWGATNKIPVANMERFEPHAKHLLLNTAHEETTFSVGNSIIVWSIGYLVDWLGYGHEL